MNNPLVQKNNTGANLIGLVLILLALLGAVFYVRPLYADVSKANENLRNQEEIRDEKSAQLNELIELEKELESSSEVAAANTLLSIPVEFEQDELIRDLTDMAIENDMILNGISFSIPSSSAPGQISTANISLNVNGSFTKLISYLRDIEGNTRKLVVKNISVQLGDTSSFVSRINFNLNIETYFQGII